MRKRKPGAQLESEPVSDIVRKSEIKIDVCFDLISVLVLCLNSNFLMITLCLNFSSLVW